MQYVHHFIEYSRYAQVVETRKIVHWLLINYQHICFHRSQRGHSDGRIGLK